MKKKILIYSDCFVYSGSENVVENILECDSINNEFEVSFCFAKGKEYEQGIERNYAGFKNVFRVSIVSLLNTFGPRPINKNIAFFLLYFLSKTGLAQIANLLILLKVFRELGPDILYINNGGYPGAASCLTAVLAAKIARVRKVVLNVNNIAFPASSLFQKCFDKLIGDYVDIFVTASISAGQSLSVYRGFNLTKWIQIPNTLSKKTEDRTRKFTEAEASEINILENPIIVGAVGLLTKRKGFDVLVQAVDIINKSGKYRNKFKVLIFGEGEERESLEESIRLNKLDGVIQLPGFRSNIHDYFVDFDIFVVPSVANEDFPYVVIEAMALGKPVIGTKLAGIPEQIQDGNSGYLVEPRDANALAKSIETYLNHPDLARQAGKVGQARYNKYFCNEVIMNKYFKLFKSLLVDE